MSLRLAYTRRSYHDEDQGGDADGAELDGRLGLGPNFLAALTLNYETGTVGRRWLVAPRLLFESADRDLQLDGRGYLMSFDDPVQPNQHALTLGCSASTRWRFGHRQALLLTAELNSNRFHPLQLRLFAVLDLAFHFSDDRSAL
jgi:hypothetical protein